MHTPVSPLEMVESIAAEFAQQARQQKTHVNGFAMPGLATSIMADGAAIALLLRLLAENGLIQVQDIKDGSVLIEALPQKNIEYDHIRFAVTFGRQDLKFDDAEELRKQLLTQSIADSRCDELLSRLDTFLRTDEELIGRGVRYFFSVPVIHDRIRKTPPVTNEMLRDVKMFLVANDPAPNRIIQIYARHAGIELEGAPTGNEAIIELARWGHEIKILAVAPPIEDLSPVQIADMVRNSELSHLKLLYVAAWDDPADRLAHIEAGFDDTIAKPFTKQQLFRALARLAGPIIKPKKDPQVMLIAEDNAINAQLAYFQLRKLGYEAEIVRNGKEALEAVVNGSFLAVFMDLQMPIMNGIEAIKRIRDKERQGKTGHVPIIALTANTHMESEAMAAGCDYFLSKPAKLSDVQRALEHCLANQGIIVPGRNTPASRADLDFNA